MKSLNINTGGDLSVRNLTAAYVQSGDSVVVLENVCLNVADQSVLAIIGESGCGKSTLLKVLAGVITDYKGKVTIGGSNINPKRQSIGYLPQNYGLLPWKTVEENITLGAMIHGDDIIEPSRQAELKALLLEIGLEEYRYRYPRELSGGQQQRVGLARVYFLHSDILLMDEPFSALDTITRESMQEIFLRLRQRRPLTTLLVTHYVDEALRLGDKIAIMTRPKGQIVEIIDNPLKKLAIEERRSDEEFSRLGLYIRQRITELGVLK